MLISIHLHTDIPFGFLLFCSITLCFFNPSVFCFVFFTEELVPIGHTFICMTLLVGGGEPGLLGNQAALAPRIIPS